MGALRRWRGILLCALLSPAALFAAGSSGPSPTTTPPQEVRVGVFLHNVESLNIADNTYYLDFAFWLRWKGPIDPTKTFRLMNVRDTWGLTCSRDDEAPITLPDGSCYQSFRVEGRFYRKFWLDAFPLDWQQVVIDVEDREYNREKLVYVPDPDSAVAPNLSIPGWLVRDVGPQENTVHYPTTFGLGSEWGRQDFSQFRFKVLLQRPPSYFLFRILPPIALVLLSAFTVFYLRPEYVDARLGTVVGGLLAEVFLYLTFTTPLPALGTMTLLDLIFNIAFLTLFLMLVECIVVTRRTDQAAALEPASDQARALRASVARLEACSRWLFPTVFAVACAGAIWLVRGAAVVEALGR